MIGIKILTGGFALLFAFFMAMGLAAIIWAIGDQIEKVIENYQINKQIREAEFHTPLTDEQTKSYVLEMRRRQDSARLARIKKQRAERDARMKLDLGDEDLTVEMFQQGAPKFLLCKNPIDRNGKTLFFREVLRGVAISEGVRGLRDARVYWTPLRHYARRMVKSEAEAWVKKLPDSKNIFIVSDGTMPQETVTAIENRIVEKLIGDGIGLDDLTAAAEASA